MSTEDLFDGLRQLPSELPQLREHLANINKTLQTKYCLPAELTEFALQPEQSEEFYDLYNKEINRIIIHLSKVTGNKFEVKVDPMKYPSGIVLQRAKSENGDAEGADSNKNTKDVIAAIINNNNNITVDSSLTPQPVSSAQAVLKDEEFSDTFASKWESALHLANKQIALRELCEKETKAVCAEMNKTWLECTPAAQIHSQKNTYDDKMPQGDSTNTASSPDNDQMSTGVVDSEIRARKESELFSTPPEFNGFNVPMATPSSSDGVSPSN